MKLFLPFVDELAIVDSRLLRLAEFLGASCETLELSQSSAGNTSFFDKALPEGSCCVINPEVMQRWTRGNDFPSLAASALLERCSHLLVHGVRPGQFDAGLITLLSEGHLTGAHEIENSGQSYRCADGSRDFCEAFSGLALGMARPGIDRVFALGKLGARALLSIDDRPYVASVSSTGAKVFFLGTQEIVDLQDDIGEDPVSNFFSRLLPHAMTIRAIFGDEVWRPTAESASLVVDDPVLRENYGFLNFKILLTLMQRHNCHTSLAFIPHNYRRCSSVAVKLFLDNPTYLSLCFHGNDHTQAEFASKNSALLHTFVATAEKRIGTLQKMTGMSCDKVMVFPQGKFSVEAMDVLRSRNFDAAVNTVAHPTGDYVRLRLPELCQPAITRYGNFPLFLRRSINHCEPEDVAFDLFFGKPVLVVEHHQIFQEPEPLLDVITRINSLCPTIRWVGLARAVRNAILRRRNSDGIIVIRGYSNSVEVRNLSSQSAQYSVEWPNLNLHAVLEFKAGDTVAHEVSVQGDDRVRVQTNLPPHTSQLVSVVQRGEYPVQVALGMKWKTKAFVRRRLSEIRDDYLSKNAPVLAFAKTLQRLVAHE
jgi:hypothetical protein